MSTNPPSNIFDEASKRLRRKTATPKPSETSPPSPPASSDGKKLLNYVEVQEIFARMWRMQQEIQEKIDLIYEKTGMTRSKIESYLSNSNNFNPGVWDSLQKNIESLEQKIWSTVGKDVKKRSVDKKQQKLSKERKGKTLGGRKKWISMH